MRTHHHESVEMWVEGHECVKQDLPRGYVACVQVAHTYAASMSSLMLGKRHSSSLASSHSITASPSAGIRPDPDKQSMATWLGAA